MIGAGIYYPEDPLLVREQLQRAILNSPTARGSAPVVIAPYGAYSLSLPYIAATVRAAAAFDPEAVIVLAPPHSAAPNALLLPESEEFETPFGSLPVEQSTVAALTTSGVYEYDEIAHLQNHSIEVLLPALHYSFGPVPIVPILVGSLTRTHLARAVTALAPIIAERRTLVVVAANMSGFTQPVEADARARKIVRLLMTSPGDLLFDALDTLEDPPRSMWPVAIAHLLAGGTYRPTVLTRGTYETEYEGDVGSVVFASIAYLNA
jgi:AmmeMemoRadiSam system protein B